MTKGRITKKMPLTPHSTEICIRCPQAESRSKIGFPNTAAPQPTLIPFFASRVVRSPIFLQTTFARHIHMSGCKGLDMRAQVRPGTGLQARGQPVQNRISQYGGTSAYCYPLLCQQSNAVTDLSSDYLCKAYTHVWVQGLGHARPIAPWHRPTGTRPAGPK
jgi:hypothetical protein